MDNVHGAAMIAASHANPVTSIAESFVNHVNAAKCASAKKIPSGTKMLNCLARSPTKASNTNAAAGPMNLAKNRSIIAV